MSNIPRLDHVFSLGVSAHHVLSCRVDIVHSRWVLLSARPTSMLVGNVTAVFPAVVVVVQGFDVLGIYELSGGEMAHPWSLLLSSAGVVVSVAWIPIVAAVASVPAIAVVPLLSFVVDASISLTASTVIIPVLFLDMHLLLWFKRHLICWRRCAIFRGLAHHLCLLELLLQLCVGCDQS